MAPFLVGLPIIDFWISVCSLILELELKEKIGVNIYQNSSIGSNTSTTSQGPTTYPFSAQQANAQESRNKPGVGTGGVNAPRSRSANNSAETSKSINASGQVPEYLMPMPSDVKPWETVGASRRNAKLDVDSHTAPPPFPVPVSYYSKPYGMSRNVFIQFFIATFWYFYYLQIRCACSPSDPASESETWTSSNLSSGWLSFSKWRIAITAVFSPSPCQDVHIPIPHTFSPPFPISIPQLVSGARQFYDSEECQLLFYQIYFKLCLWKCLPWNRRSTMRIWCRITWTFAWSWSPSISRLASQKFRNDTSYL